MWDMANLDKEKTIFFYVGFYNGITYFQLDRSKITPGVTRPDSLPFVAPSTEECTEQDSLPADKVDKQKWCDCKFGDKHFNGYPYDGRCRPWFIAAYKNRDQVMFSEPYPGSDISLIYITFSKYQSLNG